MKKIISVFLIICLLLCLSACGISKKDATGRWSATYFFNGANISSVYVLERDGNYSAVTYRDGYFSSDESGTWEIKGGDVVLHENGNQRHERRFTYEGGALVNNNHRWYKS